LEERDHEADDPEAMASRPEWGFEPGLLFDVLPSGGVAFSDSSAYAIKLTDPSGAVARILRRPIRPLPVTESMRREERERRLERARNPIMTGSRSPEATTKGHILKVRAAPADELAMFRQLDREMPELPIVIGHGFGLDGLELAAGSRNIHLELCTTYPEQNVYRSALDAVGAEHVVFGTDLDLISPAFVLGSLWEAELSAAEERLVLRENALRLLGRS